MGICAMLCGVKGVYVMGVYVMGVYVMGVLWGVLWGGGVHILFFILLIDIVKN